MLVFAAHGEEARVGLARERVGKSAERERRTTPAVGYLAQGESLE